MQTRWWSKVVRTTVLTGSLAVLTGWASQAHAQCSEPMPLRFDIASKMKETIDA